jgi:hypothetical protein
MWDYGAFGPIVCKVMWHFQISRGTACVAKLNI